MKPILYLLFTLVFVGCSASKPVKPTASCFQYQQELDELKSKKQNHILKNVTALVIKGNLSHQEDKRIDEKIRVLELKLLECER